MGVIVLCAGIASMITLTIKEDLRRIRFTQDSLAKAQDMLSIESIEASLKLSARMGPMIL